MPAGVLTVVGTGIAAGLQTTIEARALIRTCAEVLYLVADPVAEGWILSLNPRARSLQHHYEEHEQRIDAYAAMVDEILEPVRAGAHVCAAFYGHPGVFVLPSHVAVRRAREEGYLARMLPAVAADACLFADLGVDPGQDGCQSYEATEFVLRGRQPDTTSPLVLWQPGAVGAKGLGTNPRGLPMLLERLLEAYPPDHEVVLYEASPYPGVGAHMECVPLADVREELMTGVTTLYVPPTSEREIDPALLERLRPE